jgi:hypothetical protein
MDLLWTTNVDGLDFLDNLHTYGSVFDYLDGERQQFFRSLRPLQLLLLSTQDLASLKLGIRLKIDNIRRHMHLPPAYTRFEPARTSSLKSIDNQ